MKKFIKSLYCLLLVLLAFTLVACEDNNNTDENNSAIDNAPTAIDHYYGDKISFADMGISLGDNKFLQKKVAKLQLKSVTDGDTAVFYLDGESDGYTNALGRSYGYITVRFLAIDTPESTSSIAPWGKKASNYAKTILESAAGIIVDATSIDTSNVDQYPTLTSTFSSGCRLDSNGTRWLGLIWYCPEGKDAEDLNNYRLYQLDMIEECYSYYTGNLGETPYVYTAGKDEPKLKDRYSSTFGSLKLSDLLLEADIRMQTLKMRHTGSQQDLNYDYSDEPTQATIKEAYENWDEWMNNAKFVELTGVITAFIGNNFYFQDGEGFPLYVYMGIDSKNIGKMFKVGDTISIRGRLAVYGGQKQMSGVVWAEDTFKKITDPAKMIPMPEIITLTQADLNTDKLNEVMNKLVRIELKADTSLGNISKDKSYTIYTSNKIIGEVDPNYSEMSIRINGTLAPGYEYDDVKAMYTGKTIVVVGILSTYLEQDLTKDNNYPSYQIVVGNRVKDSEGNLLSDINLK